MTSEELDKVLFGDTVSKAFKSAASISPMDLAKALYEQGKLGLETFGEAVRGERPSQPSKSPKLTERMFDLTSLAPIAGLPAAAMRGGVAVGSAGGKLSLPGNPVVRGPAERPGTQYVAPRGKVVGEFNPTIAGKLSLPGGPIR